MMGAAEHWMTLNLKQFSLKTLQIKMFLMLGIFSLEQRKMK